MEGALPHPRPAAQAAGRHHQGDGGRTRRPGPAAHDGACLLPGHRPLGGGRTYEASKDQMVPISDQELDDLPLPTAKAIDVEAFVAAERLDPIRFGKPYFLQADGAVAAKPYVLLREALQRSSKVAVVKFAWHNRERLGGLRGRRRRYW
ncbi:MULTISPECIES: Ku protein [Streptomyces]